MNKSILLVADPFISIPPETYGGIERIVDFLAEGLSKRGWITHLACKTDSKCPVLKIPLESSNYHRWSRMKNALRIARQIRKENYSIIHSFGHIDLTALLWPLNYSIIQSFQSIPIQSVLKKRLDILPLKNMTFTVCGQHMVKEISTLVPTTGIHNGVKIDKFQFVERVPEDAPFVFLGRIEPIKGTHHAIRIAKATGRKLIIAGNISDNNQSIEYFSSMVKPELSDRIRYIGPINDLEKNKLLGSAAALLMPIEWNEPFGIVMVEALACGTPVIGMESGAIPEIVEDGITGACCGSVEEMINAARFIHKYDRYSCRRVAETEFSSDVIINQYENLYNRIISEMWPDS
jgi:glycosyltransferase involved in cell wall biosynthesis